MSSSYSVNWCGAELHSDPACQYLKQKGFYKMKAVVLTENAVLKYQDIPLREIPCWYRVKIAFAGICGSDIGRGFKSGAYHYPLVMGHEFSGVIDDSPVNAKYAVGTKVAIYPLLPCGECDACRMGMIHLCSNYDYFGSRRDGGFAQYIYVPETNIIPLPKEVSLEEAALAEPAAVAHHAIYSAPLLGKRRVLVIGGGPVGLLAAQWLRIRGCREIVVSDISKDKLNFAAELGFMPLFADGLADVQNSAFDICVEACGLSVTRNTAVCCCRRKGHVFLIGNPSGTLEMEPKIYSAILRKELSMNGSWNSLPKQDWNDVLQHAGKDLSLRNLITAVYPLSQADFAFRNIQSSGTFHCKTLLNCQA